MYRLKETWFNYLCGVFALFLLFANPYQPASFADFKLTLAPILDFLIPAAHAQAASDLLKSTPDANTTDPYIVQKAAELGNDPARIFAFVRDEIGFESYTGSLRGARGTLWSKAGNALDQASLMIALLRASGVPAQYVQGTLSDERAKELILSMFSSPLRVVGCPPDDAVRADPANDPQLLTETRQHYWVEFGSGGFTAADPTFKGAQLGQTFAGAQGTFAEVPDNLRHKVTVRLKAEFPAGIAGTAGFQTETPLNQTFNTVDLVGKPLSIGHFVSSFSPPALIFGYTTYTYSPYILIGQNGSDISNDHIIRGEDYQELLTNFPLASQILTGLFLAIDVQSPDGKVETFERTLFDRLGFDVRQNGGAISLGSEGPSLSDLDLVTINVLPGLQSLDAIAQQRDRVESLQTQLNGIKPQIDAIPASGPQTAAQRAVLSKSLSLTRETLVSNAEILTMAFAGASDVALRQLQQGYLTKGYYTSPRLLLTLTKREANNLSVKLDLRKNDLRAVPAPGQVSGMDFPFEMARGLMESTLEGEIFSRVTGTQAISVADIFGNLGDDTSLTLITANNLQLLEGTTLSATAKARISQAAEAGNAVLTPTRMVTIGNLTTVGWLEIDFRSGHTIGVMEDGGHQALFEYPQIPSTPANIISGAFIGFELGFVQGNIIFISNFLADVSAGTPFVEAVKRSKLAVVNEMLGNYFDKVWDVVGLEKVLGDLGPLLSQVYECISLVPQLDPGDPGGPLELSKCIIEAYQTVGLFPELPPLVDLPIFTYTFVGMGTALAWIDRNAPVDPPVFPFLSSDLGPGPAPVAPGTVPSVAAQIVPDAFFTIPVNGAEVPAVFKAEIQNRGPVADTFALAFSGVPAGFKIQSSVPSITIPAGETGEVGICVLPTGQIPSSGATAPFSINVASTTNQAVSAVASQTFTMPEIPAITLASDPTQLSSTPGTPVSSILTITAVGNAPASNVTLAINASPGLTVSGLTSPITLNAGDSINQSLTLTPAANAPLNSTLTATITATFGTESAPQTASTQVSLLVRSNETVAVEKAALAAADADNTQLAETLSALGDTLGQLQGTPTDEGLWGRLALQLGNTELLLQANPSLTQFVPQLQELRNFAAAHDLSALLAPVPGLFTNMTSAIVIQAAAQKFTAALSPTNVELQPGENTQFIIRLENRGNEPLTLLLTLGGLPNGVTATLNQNQVTLAPGEVRDASSANPVILTLNQSLTSLQIFSAQVTATDHSSGAEQIATAYVAVRPALADVISVTVDPVVVNPGSSVAVSAQVLNAANAARSVLARVEVRNQAGSTVATNADVPVNLVPGTAAVTLNLGSVATTGLTNGLYNVRVSLLGLDGGPLPGRAAQTLLFIGLPVSATVRAEPALVAPGTAKVATIIEVTNQLVPVGSNPSLSQTEINTTIQKGLAYLYATRQLYQQQGYDWVYWSYYGYEPAATGAAVFAMLSQKSLWGTNTAQYQAAVDKAMNYLLSVAATFTVGDPPTPPYVRADGYNPCGSDSTCLGVYWNATGSEITYTTGLIAPAIALYAAGHANDVATTSGPLAGKTWSQIAQGITNMFALSQSTIYSGNRRGGWRYYPGEGDSDSSTTQWAIISMIYDQTLGATTPQFVRDELKYWLAAAQYIDPNQPAWNGVACYQPGAQPCDHADTGGLLLGLKFVGDDLSNSQVQAALSFLNTNWTQVVNNYWYGNFGHPYAMWSVYKGLETTIGLNDTTHITNLRPGQCGGIPSANCNWWQDYNQWLVSNQQGDGSWSGYYWWVDVLATAFNLSILSGANIPTINLNLSMRHQLPPSGYVVDSGSVSPPAESLSPSEVVWPTQTFSTRTVTYQLSGQAPDLTSGESRQISLGTAIIAEVITAGGERITVPINLPPAVIAVTHRLGLTPSSQTVGRGAQALYNVQITNSMGTPETFSLSTVGLEEFSTALASSVTVPAGQTITTPLTVTVPAGVAEVTRTFSIRAQTASGGFDTVEGRLIIAGGSGGGGGPPPEIALESRAVVVEIVPTQSIAGQGTAATFRVRLTNTGSVTEQFSLSASLPAGINGAFSQDTVDVPPGLDNFRDVLLTLVPTRGTPTGAQTFTVTVVSTAQSSVKNQASATMTIVANGVAVTINPTSGGASSVFQLTVINTGQIGDTFDLALGGPVGPLATLGTTAVTLQPGASQTVPVTLSNLNFALPGNLNLIAVATSRTNTAVQANATAQVTIPISHGVTAVFDPATVVLDTPGSAKSLLVVQNTGNTEDAFAAAITGTSGLVTGTFSGLDGQPTQTVPLFRLPGLATGAIPLDARLPDFGTGGVTARVNSLNTAQVNATASVTVSTSNMAPQADAGPDQTVLLGQTVTLNGSGSRDLDNGPQPLSFHWRLVAKPSTSTLTDADISGATSAQAVFKPDVAGEYRLELTVSDGVASAVDAVVIQVEDNRPIAKAGPHQNVKTGTAVTLDGSDSVDPAGQLLTYHWRFEGKPATSSRTDADITGAQTPSPSFTPDVDGLYQLRLIVQAEQRISEPAFVEIKATSQNVPPNARAGVDQTALTGNLVHLDGSASYDPDEGPGSLTYLWTLAQRPTGSQLTDAGIVDATQSKANFTPDVPGDYVLNLQVADGRDSDNAQVTITSLLPNVPPNAVAGPAQHLILGATASLDGTASTDPDNSPNPLTFTWRFVFLPEGSHLSNANLANAQSAKPSFIPDIVGDYVVRLEVSDGQNTAADNVLLTVTALPPITTLSARAKDSKIDILWTPVTDAVGYNIFRSTTTGGSYTLIQQGHVTDYAAFADFGLTNGVKYCYVVRWVNASGQESPDSNEACAMPTGRPRR